ncbi:MAG: VOC family protein [Gammaproteobacteria bacterium]|nr:VOC family protein [Gammaproteobacteria bacterium]
MRGVTQLGYLGFTVADRSAWIRLLTELAGVAAAASAEDTASFRLDGYAQRLLLLDGVADDLLCCGWEVPDCESLAAMAAALAACGHVVVEGTAAQCRQRRVEAFLATRDPAGVPVEIYTSAQMDPQPCHLPQVAGGFVAGSAGLGHVVLRCDDLDASAAFYTDLLGLQPSDHIRARLGPYDVHALFLHANRRHHSVAFAAGIPLARCLHHFMLEYATLDDLGRAWYRCLDAGVPIARSIGMHPNDRMLSFYVTTPSGFELELGWGGRTVDAPSWSVRTYAELSSWGHRPPA